jgi:tetratricopeptide (TPR) repeat protein
MLKAMELNPKDPMVYFILGMWCFKVASIDFISRNMAKMIFSAPPESSFEEALGYFLKSEELDATIRNRVAIANTYKALKDNANAKIFYNKALELTPVSVEEQEELARARQAL